MTPNVLHHYAARGKSEISDILLMANQALTSTTISTHVKECLDGDQSE